MKANKEAIKTCSLINCLKEELHSIIRIEDTIHNEKEIAEL